MGETTVISINEICQFLNQFAPIQLGEEWDNVGLLVGDRQLSAERIMTCLTITPNVVEEAIEQRANLIVSHHPLPFHATKRLTTDSIPSRMLWDLIRAGIGIYSPHTGFDSAEKGINQSIANRLGLSQTKPLIPVADPDDDEAQEPVVGAGRTGVFKVDLTLKQFTQKVKDEFKIDGLHVVGSDDAKVCRVGIACGSGGSFLKRAQSLGCDTFVTGETTFHTCLEAKSSGISLVLLGHYASERFAIEMLADEIATAFESCNVWSSKSESDPLRWV